MKRFVMFVFVVAILGVTFGWAAHAQAATPEEMVKAAGALDKAFQEAMNKGDAVTLAAMYSTDAVNFPPDVLQVRGSAAIKDGFAAMFAKMPGAKLELTEAHNIPAGDMVIGWGLWKMTMAGPDGKPVEMVGRFTDVKAERNGKWVYIVDHASCPMPPMEEDMGHEE